MVYLSNRWTLICYVYIYYQSEPYIYYSNIQRERKFSHFLHPTYLDKRHFGSFDISPPLSVDLLPSLPADSTRNPRGTSAGSSFDGCEENSDPPEVSKHVSAGFHLWWGGGGGEGTSPLPQRIFLKFNM